MTKPSRTQYSPPVSIIGTGASTAVGFTAATTAASVTAGINRITQHPYMVDSRGEPFITVHAQYLPILINALERCWELGLSAASEAIEVIASVPADMEEIPVIIGLPGTRPGFTDKMAGEIAARFEKLTHPFCRLSPVETVRGGHAAGLSALEKGCGIISEGHAPLCLVGGIDSWINPDDLEHLDLQGMLHSNANPWGMVPGEGAGFCLLASEKTLETLDIPSLATIPAISTAMEENLINTDTVCTGEGLSRAVSLAAGEGAPPDSGIIDRIICDLNGLRYRADEFGFALVKNGKLFKAPTSNGPVPINYPNIAFSKDLVKSTTTVLADGGHMCGNKGSEFYKSIGDEPGSVGGVTSGTHLAEATWITYSHDVFMEGKNVCRLADKMLMNHGNTACLTGVKQKNFSSDPLHNMLCNILCEVIEKKKEFEKDLKNKGKKFKFSKEAEKLAKGKYSDELAKHGLNQGVDHNFGQFVVGSVPPIPGSSCAIQGMPRPWS